jgi:hypothetical protein
LGISCLLSQQQPCHLGRAIYRMKSTVWNVTVAPGVLMDSRPADFQRGQQARSLYSEIHARDDDPGGAPSGQDCSGW